MSLADVYLLTAASDGELAVGGLTVVIDHVGLTVFNPSGQPAAALPWAELTVLRTGGPVRGPGGEDAVLLEASSSVRSHRFAVPTTDPVLLEDTIAEITGIPAADRPRKAKHRR